MGEGLVGLGHLVRVVALLHRVAAVLRGVDELGGEPLAHRLLAAVARVRDEPAHRQRDAALRADLDGDLVGRATDAAALDLELRLHVVERLAEDLERLFLEALLDDVERAVEDALGGRLLAARASASS